MRGKLIFLASVLVLVLSVSNLYAAEFDAAAKKDLLALQGTWVMDSGQSDGKPVPADKVKQNKITYEGNKMTIRSPHQTPDIIIAEIVRLDPTKTPKEMSFVRKSGPNAGKTMVGLYDIKGDTYIFAFDPKGETTPKELSAKAGTGHLLHTWKRSK